MQHARRRGPFGYCQGARTQLDAGYKGYAMQVTWQYAMRSPRWRVGFHDNVQIAMSLRQGLRDVLKPSAFRRKEGDEHRRNGVVASGVCAVPLPSSGQPAQRNRFCCLSTSRGAVDRQIDWEHSSTFVAVTATSGRATQAGAIRLSRAVTVVDAAVLSWRNGCCAAMVTMGRHQTG